ncbi:alpha-amanitin target protein [Variola virus]|uniref:Protein OPG036 n=3 Tax=Variola virus TaxID=10255 RepID=PG036_VAR67|nr:putative alpha aminitin-sensitive protein [Variola virus]P0DSQ1.1 RecName: Full=Protein OPG036; AltName: Full=Protein N2 [Variola virus human/India/Ind3/1967]P0DSQ2.1 RecName: Full=Protein OPG036; AltName: Full=Protein N2 [Variola virus]AAA60765.1 homolog of vaccinia virus CDS N2L; putative [Variola major virus]AAA69322.1 P2L [Variola virus]AAA69428.1 P2L [Variola virus]ABF23593.1 alpha-amanitin target protein [Variola virus]ABF23789.1 alpha-amanitin target protein [Variola virus]
MSSSTMDNNEPKVLEMVYDSPILPEGSSMDPNIINCINRHINMCLQHTYSSSIIAILDRFLMMNKDELNNTQCHIIKEFMTYEQMAIDHYGGYVNAILYQIRKRPNQHHTIDLFKKIKRTRYDTFKVDPVEFVKKVIGFVSILNKYKPVYSYVLYENVLYDELKCFIDYVETKYFQN